MERAEKILSTNNLKGYYFVNSFGKKITVKAVEDVSINVFKNEVYGIAGESGCGKSTLLKILFDAVEPPLRVVDGKVSYFVDSKEYNIFELDQRERQKFRWKFVSYVPQGSMNVLNPVIKIKETFKDFIKVHKPDLSDKELIEEVRKHILELGLRESILNSYPHQLSGGMRQRVTIALATVLKPKLIIADEPTTALDVVTQRGVIQLIKDLQSSLKNTVILVTHDMGVHANIADRIGIMYAGRFVEEAETLEIFEQPRHPYTKFLIESIPTFGEKRERKSAPGSPPSLAQVPSGCPFHPRCPYVIDKCKVDVPPFKEHTPGHKTACWLLEV
ncbi:MAG: ABC transporter ATP-binding protein [Fervidobacterium nodosum]